MANYGFCFCPVLHREDCSGTLYLWVEDNRKTTRFVPTRYDIRREEWNPVEGSLVFTESDVGRRRELMVYAKSMVEDIRRIDTIVRELEPKGNLTADEVIEHYRHPVFA